jgi:hypothetical protein
MQQAEVLDVKVASVAFQIPNAASTAEDILGNALGFCAQKMGYDDPQIAIERLKEGDRTACGHCQYSIAQQVGAALAALDDNVRSVYMFEYDATPEDICFSEAAQTPLLHLIVWTERKTKALNSLVTMLERALAQSYARLIGLRQLQHLLDVQVVDDGEVKGRIGYGALFSSLHHRPLKVWER